VPGARASFARSPARSRGIETKLVGHVVAYKALMWRLVVDGRDQERHPVVASDWRDASIWGRKAEAKAATRRTRSGGGRSGTVSEGGPSHPLGGNDLILLFATSEPKLSVG
jgi:hypothetical protein